MTIASRIPIIGAPRWMLGITRAVVMPSTLRAAAPQRIAPNAELRPRQSVDKDRHRGDSRMSRRRYARSHVDGDGAPVLCFPAELCCAGRFSARGRRALGLPAPA